MVSYVPKKNWSVVLLLSLHHGDVVCDDTEKPEIIEYYNKTKGALDTLDNMCAQYTVKRAIWRWTIAMFYGMVNIASVNAFVIYAYNMRKQQPHMKLKRKEFLFSIARHLVTVFATQRYKFLTLSTKIKDVLILRGFALDSNKSTARNTEDYSAMLRKRGRCHLCDRGRDVKTQFVCKLCVLYACNDNVSMTITCDDCNIQDAEGKETK